jgi:hypothetical protein
MENTPLGFSFNCWLDCWRRPSQGSHPSHMVGDAGRQMGCQLIHVGTPDSEQKLRQRARARARVSRYGQFLAGVNREARRSQRHHAAGRGWLRPVLPLPPLASLSPRSPRPCPQAPRKNGPLAGHLVDCDAGRDNQRAVMVGEAPCSGCMERLEGFHGRSETAAPELVGVAARPSSVREA